MPSILKHIFDCRGILILFLLLYSVQGISQDQNEWIEQGDQAMQVGLYKTALQNYEVALKSDRNNVKILYKCAEASRLYNNYSEAIRWYGNIIALNAERQFPDLFYHLGEMYRNIGKFDTAIILFDKYLDAPLSASQKFADKANSRIASCQWALQNNKAKDSIKVKHLNNKINTKNSESAAILMGDSLLLFTSLRGDIESGYDEEIIPDLLVSNIYESKKRGNRYSIASVNEWELNSRKKHTANTCFDRLNKRMYFTYCEEDNYANTQCNIYYSDLKENGKWTNPKKLCEEINMPGYTATQPAVEIKDGKTILYFVSDRPNGNGGLDIWHSVMEEGKCRKAINLGYPINTKGNEATPFYDQQSQTLYFSSDYHHGFGGYDIFFSKGSMNQWSIPQNLGIPVNSYANDLYYSVNEDSISGYLTSNRIGSFFIDNNTCCNDIYEWNLVAKDTLSKTGNDVSPQKKKELSFTGYKVSIDSLLPIKLYFHNDEPDPKTQKLTTEKTYHELFTAYCELEDLYIRNYTKGLKGSSLTEAEDEMKNFFEKELKYNYQHLEKFTILLLNDLKQGKHIRLIIKGYSSPLYTGEYNKNLSKRRISSFINQLLKSQSGNIAHYINSEDPNSGSLEIVELALGSSTADSSISRNPNDKRNSVYGIEAAKERRLEILAYQYQDTSANSTYSKNTSQLVFGKEIFSLGSIPKNRNVQAEILVLNNSVKPQEIEILEVGCGCMKAHFKKIIPPMQNGFITLDINVSKVEPGIYLAPITIKLRSESFTQTIFVEYQVE